MWLKVHVNDLISCYVVGCKADWFLVKLCPSLNKSVTKSMT